MHSNKMQKTLNARKCNFQRKLSTKDYFESEAKGLHVSRSSKFNVSFDRIESMLFPATTQEGKKVTDFS